MPVKVSGVDTTAAAIAKKLGRIQPELEKAASSIYMHMERAATPLAPTKEGHLRGSISTGGEVVTSGPMVSAVNTAGRGVSSAYAAYQHNTVGLNHPRGGGPFFLTKPLNTNMGLYRSKFEDAVKRALR